MNRVTSPIDSELWTERPPPMPRDLVYRSSLDAIEEAVISAHFMHELNRDPGLDLYGDAEFARKSIAITERQIDERLLPALLRASRRFARERAAAAKARAADHLAEYGLADAAGLGAAEFVTELMFDRQFRGGRRETCSRRDIRAKVAERIAAGSPIGLAIAALPYKFSSPLKTRGQLPDLCEVNFILGLY